MSIGNYVMKKLVTIFFFILTVSSTAHAATITCKGTVAEIETLYTGIVRLNVSGSGVSNKAYFCSVKSEWKGISAEVCKSWVSKAIAARVSGKPVEITYLNSSSCSSLPINSASTAPYSVSF